MVSHDTEVAMYADRIVHMLDGRITSIEDNRKNTIAIQTEEERSEVKAIHENEINENDIPERGTEVE